VPNAFVEDSPKLLADPAARAARTAQLGAPHVAPLTAFVRALRDAAGLEASVPDFDPWDGGTQAEVLFLLEAPGPKAVMSGFISRNNPDESAKNFFELNAAAGIARGRTATWNIVPWYIGTGSRIRAATRTDIEAGIPSLVRLLDLLPRLRAIVFVGEKAARADEVIAKLRPGLRRFRSPHPSPLYVNNAPGNRDHILSALRRVARFLDGDESVA
jgi:uracil-DNA glycosylase